MKMKETRKNGSGGILFILPVLGQPRHAKRIEMLAKVGFRTEAVAFDRKYHRGRTPGCPVYILGKVSHGNYVQRFFRIVSGIPRLRKRVRRSEIIYAFGPDMVFLAHCAAFGLGKGVVLEVGDIREAQVENGLSGRLLRFFEKLVTERCCFLVVTAQGFIEHYYRKMLKSKVDIVLIENKLDFALRHISDEVSTLDSAEQFKGRPIRIGYFGLLRCAWSLVVLDALARSKPQDVEIIVAGYFMDQTDIVTRFLALPNVFYRGEYRSTPGELEKLYSGADIIWAANPYFGASMNPWVFLLKRTNRFYESCFFRRPMITFEGTGDSAEVLKYGLGFAVEDESVNELVDFIYNEVRENLGVWQRNIASIPETVFLYTSEADELKSKMVACVDQESRRRTY
ncbi:hypothetical protein ABC977_08105 [Thioalkalicoccus limnaeus]|uniref:Glycosyltransferase subfamily 4-like N-terminal domain-containing protein n=1 Tax=Thioalkalicoccus limnaeus TaxID=120681 RepID=A0ABV4BCX3_9GAMM